MLDELIIKKVERDLYSYPDWIVRLDASGLGLPSRTMAIGGRGYSFSSTVESLAELQDEIERKVYVIEKTYDRLRGKTKEIIELKYYRDYQRFEVLEKLAIKKNQYYNLRDRAFESFARSLGYIE
jgi:ArpU family phage transcriptional regulator